MGCGSSVKPSSADEFAAAVKPFSFIIWGAQGKFGGADAVGHGDLYCVVRVGPQGAAWSELPRGRGRRSETVSCKPAGDGHGEEMVEWRMGFVIDLDGLENPEVQIEIFDADVFSEADYLGGARSPLSNLLKSDTQPAELNFDKGIGSVKISCGEGIGLLKETVAPSSASYPKMCEVGEIKTCMAKDVTGDFPLRTGVAPLPAALRGVFWLSGQGDSSALGTFGGPSNDGGGCSTGSLVGRRAKVRTGGDRSWAEADLQPCKNAETIDLIYNFVFDDDVNPKKAQIYPEFKFIPAITQESILDFEMELLESDEEYPGSVVWLRKSFVLGLEGTSMRYKLIQIIDEAGQRIEPAFGKFVAYQHSPAMKEPGKIWYRQIGP